MTNQQTYQRNGQTFLSKEAVLYLFNNELLVDATAGGLVQAPSDDEDGITLVELNSKGEFRVLLSVDDWYYLLNPFAYAHYEAELDALLKPVTVAPFIPVPVPPGILTIEVKPKLVNGQWITPVLYLGANPIEVLLPCQFQECLFDLDRINRESWQKYYVDQRPTETLDGIATMARYTPLPNN